MEEDVVFKESELSPTEPSDSTDLRLSFTASLVAPIYLTFPCRRVAPASGSSTTVAISFEGAAMEDVSGSLETMLHPKKSSRPCITAQVQQGGVLHLHLLRYRQMSTHAGALPALACQLKHPHLFLRGTRWIIVLHLS